MATQRIKAKLCKEEPGRLSFFRLNQAVSKECKPIPGWTDSSAGWCAEVYSFAKPHDHSLPANVSEDPKRAYKGFITSSQRLSGVYSTLDTKYQVPQPLSDKPASLATGLSTSSTQSTTSLLLAAWHCLLGQGSDSRSKWARVFTDALCSIELLS